VRAKYVGFEGIDGSGKDTQIAALARRLDRNGITPIVLHEPSYGPVGREIRDNLQSLSEDPAEQRRLFLADRRDHVSRKINPALRLVRASEDFAIVQNRCIVSAAAYQPLGEGDAGLIATINAELGVAPMPDAVIILDLPVDVALDRVRSAGVPDSMEKPEKLAAARERYIRLASLLPPCTLIDADASPEAVAERVWSALVG
jgi:dTMP kinase